MAIDGAKGSNTYNDEEARAGDPCVLRAGKVKADQGDLPVGLVVSKDASGEFIPYEEVADEALGTGGAAATAVAAEVVAAGDGSEKVFTGQLANGNIDPGSVEITATVGAASKTMTDDGSGSLSGDAGAGSIDYTTGLFTLAFSTAPDNATNVTADYDHTPPAKAFSGTLAKAPAEPGSVVVGDGVEAFSDDGFGRLTGDAGGVGTVNYQTGAVAVTFATAVADGTDVEADYVTKIDGVLNETVDTTKTTSAVYIARGLVSQPALKVGASAQAAPDATLLARMEKNGIFPA